MREYDEGERQSGLCRSLLKKNHSGAIQASFKVTETFPFPRIFAKKYKRYKEENNERIKVEEEQLMNLTVASRLVSFLKIYSDQELFNKFINIFDDNSRIFNKD